MTFKTSKIVCVAALVLTGLVLYCIADNTVQQQDNPTFTQGTSPFAGTYYALAKMTNGANFNIQPPSNAVSCVFQDASGFSSSYTSSIVVMRRDFHYFYTNNNNSLTIPVTNSLTYTFTVYVNSPLPPPTNGQPMTLQVTWQTNANSGSGSN